MPFPVACACGQQFMAQDYLAGQQVPCPACGNALLIAAPFRQGTAAQPKPAPQVRTPARPAAKPAEGIPGIPVRCGCGKAYKAPAAMRGKSLQCPACGQNVPIPSSPQASASVAAGAAPDPFGRDAGLLAADLSGADLFGGPLGT